MGTRPNRANPGIDAQGWRNARALDAADIVVLGDSMEYGWGVAPQSAWPQRLGQILQRPVYQMAFGGYGPGQYLLLFDEAASLRPKVVIAAYYLGNDLHDAYSLAYHTGDNAHTLPNATLRVLASKDSKVREAIRAAEAVDPGLLRSGYVGCYDRQEITDPHLQQVHDVLSIPPLGRPVHSSVPPRVPAHSESIRASLRSLLRHSMAYRVARRAFDQAAQRLVPSPAADYGSPLCVHFRDDRLKTVFSPGLRLIALDRSDPRIVEGERISLLAYQALAARCRLAGIHFYVAMIPTKETAFRPRAEPLLQHELYLRDLWDAEAGARARAFGFFGQVHIDTIDALPALQALIVSGINPYHENWDGHPVALGYDAIARAVAERLRRDGLFATLR